MMERSAYKPKPENAPREKPAMAEELATLRELVANLRGQLRKPCGNAIRHATSSQHCAQSLKPTATLRSTRIKPSRSTTSSWNKARHSQARHRTAWCAHGNSQRRDSHAT